MNKKFGYLPAVLCLFFACLVLLTACGTPRLSAPIGLYVDMETQTLHWQKVKGAAAYSVEVDGNTISTKQNQFALSALSEGEYTIKLKAVSGNDEYQDSEVVEYVFVREHETGLVYKTTANKSAYELVSIGSASGDVVMESNFRGKPVISIAKGAFRRCNRLTSLVVGEHVQTIGESAFYGCSELQSITLPQGLVSIGKNAFQNCTRLTGIVIPDGVSDLPEYTFSLCKELQSVKLGAGLKTIGDYAFADCAKLTSVEFNDQLTTIGQYAFSGCSALPSVKLGAGVTEIGSYAFYRTAALTSVEFGDRLTTIKEAAFYESALTSVTLPNSVTTVEMQAFAKCAALTEVTLGSGLQSVGYEAFVGSKIYEDATDIFRIGNWVIACKSEIREIPNADTVVGVADYCFAGQKQLASVKLNNAKYIGIGAFTSCEKIWEATFTTGSLIRIGAYAFANCEQLTDVRLSEGLLEIDQQAFNGCMRLEDSKINLPKSLTKVGQSAFNGTRAYILARGLVYMDHWLVGANGDVVQDPHIKMGTVGISDYAFNNTTPMGTVYLPDSVAYIGRGAFYKAAYVSSINLPASLKRIGDYAFYGSAMRFAEGDTPEEMFTLVIPEGTEYIGRSAFYNCATFLNLTIPGSVKYIGDYAFRGCAVGYQLPLEETDENGNPLLCIGGMTLGEGIEYIGNYAFAKNPMSGTLTIPNSVTYLGTYAFSDCALMTELNLGTGIQTISAYAFSKCKALTALTIPSNVKNIEKFAFRGCEAITDLVLCEGLEQVDTYAFYGCKAVRKLQLPGTLHTVGDYAFRGMEKLTAVMIPEGLVNLGKHAFYGNQATFYMEAKTIPATWSERWNSSYRPVILGVTLAEDHSYVVSFTKNGAEILNLSERVSITKPSRKGYTFVGWATDPNATTATYSADAVAGVSDGTVLYSVWTEGEEPEVEETPEETDDAQNGAGDNAGAANATN